MKYWKTRFMNMKIRDKMINSHILIALIPFFFVGILGVISSTREAERNVTQHTSLLVGQVQHTTDIYISSIEKTANMLIQIIEPMHLGRIPSAEDMRWNEYEAALKDSFETVADTHDEIAGIFLLRNMICMWEPECPESPGTPLSKRSGMKKRLHFPVKCRS